MAILNGPPPPPAPPPARAGEPAPKLPPPDDPLSDALRRHATELRATLDVLLRAVAAGCVKAEPVVSAKVLACLDRMGRRLEAEAWWLRGVLMDYSDL